MSGGGFLVMFTKGLLITMGIFEILDFTQSTPLLVLDLGILAFLYLAAASR